MDQNHQESVVFRLFHSNLYWNEYAVIDAGQRFYVHRYSMASESQSIAPMITQVEKIVEEIHAGEGFDLVIPRTERLVPHKGGLDHYVEMPLGISLSKLVHRVGALRVPFVASLLAEICRTLAPIHALGKGHGALHPESILVNKDGTVSLLHTERHQVLAEIHGTISFPCNLWQYLFPFPSHVAPENFKAYHPNPTSDLFSISALGFFLLTGSEPFVGGDSMEVASSIRSGICPDIREFRRELSPTLAKGMEIGLSRHVHERTIPPLQWVEETFGELETLDPLRKALQPYNSALNDWFYDAYFRTVAEPEPVDPNVVKWILGGEANTPSVNTLSDALRNSSTTRHRSRTIVRSLMVISLLVGGIGFTLLYFFMRL